MDCRICNNKTLPLETINKVANSLYRLCDEPKEVEFEKVELYQCINCGHLQTENKLSKDYYENSNNTEVGTNQYYGELNLFEEKIRKLKELVKVNTFSKGIYLEIGCGTGENLIIANKYFKECLGFEPSRTSYEYAEKKG